MNNNFQDMIKRFLSVKGYSTLFGLFLLAIIAGCSTKKNTAVRRNYHALTTKYNVYFNGNESFKKGYKKIEEAYKPDYSNILDMYYVSSKTTAGVATSDMKRTQQKCELAIKEHSIQKKPKKKVEKMRDPKYAAFYNQEEFNPKMDDVWMLFAKAKYYSNDYLAASATFTYIIKHFSGDKALVAEAMIWKAKCYKEMEWYYEADDMLKRVSDEAFNDRLNNLYSGAYADLLIAQREYKEALPHLLTAIETEKKKKTRLHFTFIAGQLYQELGMKQEAYDMYEKVVGASTTYEMEFNARIRQTEVYTGGDSKTLIAKLEKMSKKSKNADYLDQIYYAIGNIYLINGDTATAIDKYITSVDKSTRDGLDKAQSLIALGDIYYSQEKYLLAQPRYSEAASLIDDSHADYERVSRLSVILDELARDYNTVAMQDSLQALAKAPKEERMAAINREIKKIKDEEEAQRKREAEEREAAKRLEIEIDNMAVLNNDALGNKNKSTWYFSNRQTVEKGKLEFQRKYGKRKLEDDWNRKNKAMTVFSDDALAEANDFNNLDGQTQEGAETQQGSPQEQSAAENDPKRPEYYLRQIPFSSEQVAASNEQIADALFNIGVVYDEKLNDYPKAIETFNEFVRRFGSDRRVADAYFYCYRIAEKSGNEALASEYRNKIINQCGDSKYATILSIPNYKEKIVEMMAAQDSLYERTYKAYLDGNFQTVHGNYDYMSKTYPISSLMPRFALLNSLSIGKAGDRDSFQKSLSALVEKYPTSDVSSMAKDILALMTQGNNPEAGTPGGLMALREETMRKEAEVSGAGERRFTSALGIPYLFKLKTDTAQVEPNKLLYMAALYNFTKFLVKDFDLSVKDGVLSVSGLENAEEAAWYSKGIFEDDGIQRLLANKEVKSMIIATENNDLVGTKYTIEEYEKFFADSIAPNIGRKRGGAKVELVDADKAAKDSIASAQTSLNVKEDDDLNKAKLSDKNAKETPAEKTSQKPVEDETVKAAKVADEKQKAEIQRQIEEKISQGPKKDLKKYKGLYTYDKEALHYFVVLVPKGGAKVDDVRKAFDAYNAQNQPLLNLSCMEESSSAFAQMFVIGILPDASVANSYLRQVVKSNDIKASLKGVEYRNIVISKENLEILKSSGNINVYMELFKRLYLGR